MFANIFGVADLSEFSGYEFNQYKGWLNFAIETGKEIIDSDSDLKTFSENKQLELNTIIKDYESLLRVIDKNNWDLDDEFDLDLMRRKLEANNLSNDAKNAIVSPYLARIVNQRKKDNNQKISSFHK